MTRCHYCPERATTRDHVVPRKKLRRLTIPTNHPFFSLNIVPACADCNARKGHKRSTCTCLVCTALWRDYELLLRGVLEGAAP